MGHGMRQVPLIWGPCNSLVQEKLPLRGIIGFHRVHSGFPAIVRGNQTNFSANPIVPGTLAQLTSPALNPSAQVWLNTPLFSSPGLNPSPISVIASHQPVLPSQHPWGTTAAVPGNWPSKGHCRGRWLHWLCRETAGIVVPIINETALAAAPQPNPRD